MAIAMSSRTSSVQDPSVCLDVQIYWQARFAVSRRIGRLTRVIGAQLGIWWRLFHRASPVASFG
eukprot:731629-Pleurochrysis_carterae.AAC.1